MKLINKITGQILRLESGQIFGEIAENKNAATQPYNIAIAVDDALVQSLLLSNLVDWEEFTDIWTFNTKYRYFVTNEEIGFVAKTDKTAYDELFALRRVDFVNGSELYLDTIDPQFEQYINPDKLERRNG